VRAGWVGLMGVVDHCLAELERMSIHHTERLQPAGHVAHDRVQAGSAPSEARRERGDVVRAHDHSPDFLPATLGLKLHAGQSVRAPTENLCPPEIDCPIRHLSPEGMERQRIVEVEIPEDLGCRPLRGRCEVRGID